MNTELDVFSQYSWLKAYAETSASAILKQQPEDFQVFEKPLESPSGEGEHLWLEIEKTNCNTGWVAEQLADYFAIKPMNVGFAGRKDRHAKTRQAMTVYLPKTPDASIESQPFSGVKILYQNRHHKKLRLGDLAGNDFKLCLRQFSGDKQAVIDNLEVIKKQGVPNYFGSQRFGHHGQNIMQARNMLDEKQALALANKKPRRVKNQGIYLSALRSFLFNELLSERIKADNWHINSANEKEPTGALWGRGNPISSGFELEFEEALAQLHPKDCERLEHSGLNQERRKLIAKAADLQYDFTSDELHLSFYLPAGQYATCVLRELVNVTHVFNAGR